MNCIDDKIFWIWLSSLKWFGPVTINNLIKKYKDPEKIFIMKEEEIRDSSILNVKQKKELLNSKDLKNAKLIINNCKNKNISLLSFDEYPEKFKSIFKIPSVLYYKGNLSCDFKGVAITGSIQTDEYSKKVSMELVEYIIERKINIITGFKKGIEAYVNNICIQNGGVPIAFMGNGLDICYPSEQNKLFKKIIEIGLVVSQFAPGTKPFKFNICKNKFLTSACCDKMVIINGGTKGDSFNTGKMAIDLKKEVFSVPNNIYCSEGQGTNELIERGSRIYLSPKQISPQNEIQIKENGREKELNILEPLENLLVSYLQPQSRSIDEMAYKFNLSAEKIMELVCVLELKNYLKQDICGRWIVA